MRQQPQAGRRPQDGGSRPGHTIDHHALLLLLPAGRAGGRAGGLAGRADDGERLSGGGGGRVPYARPARGCRPHILNAEANPALERDGGIASVPVPPLPRPTPPTALPDSLVWATLIQDGLGRHTTRSWWGWALRRPRCGGAAWRLTDAVPHRCSASALPHTHHPRFLAVRPPQGFLLQAGTLTLGPAPPPCHILPPTTTRLVHRATHKEAALWLTACQQAWVAQKQQQRGLMYRFRGVVRGKIRGARPFSLWGSSRLAFSRHCRAKHNHNLSTR